MSKEAQFGSLTGRNMNTGAVEDVITPPGRDSVALVDGADPPLLRVGPLDLPVPVRGAVEHGGLRAPFGPRSIQPVLWRHRGTHTVSYSQVQPTMTDWD